MRPEWRYANHLGIHRRMKEIIQLSMATTKKQLEHERRKLRKLKYGS